METMKIKMPFSQYTIKDLRVGERILFSGEIYTCRDAAHKRLCEMPEKGKRLPFSLSKAVLYYAGPCPAPPGRIIGSAGPTTSKRMDAYTPALMQAGLRMMIGKGERAPEVIAAIKEFGGCYLAAIGGAGVVYANCVKNAKIVAFEDLGTEAIYKLSVRDMPLVVAVDSNGGDIYRINGE